MVFVSPTPATFKARFPEFAPVSDAFVQLILDEAALSVGETWLERDRAPAIMFLTAHKLAVQGYPKAASGGGGGASAGVVKRRKVGDVEVEYDTAASASLSAASDRAGYLQTSYGREFLNYMRRNFSAIAVV